MATERLERLDADGLGAVAVYQRLVSVNGAKENGSASGWTVCAVCSRSAIAL